MQALEQYALSLTCAAMICGILLWICPEGRCRGLLRLICGVFLAATALSPLSRGIDPVPDWLLPEYRQAAEEAALAGEEMARQEWFGRIKTGLETYILDKAAAMGQEIRAQIRLDRQGVPISVYLSGEASPEERQQLSAMITKDLGIPEEDQQWTTGK